jgi:hypothetical protein
MKQYSRFLPFGILLLVGAAAVAYLLLGSATGSRAVQNPTIHLDMISIGNTYDNFTMTVGPINASSTSSSAVTHNHSTQLVVKNVEDLVGYQVRLNYVGDKMRVWLFNPTPFNDTTHAQAVGFVNVPIDETTLVHRGVVPAESIPSAPPDGSNTAQTARVGASYTGTQTLPVSPDTPHKAVPDDASYDAPNGGVLGNVVLQVVGNECDQTMLMDLDDGVPNAPGSEATIFTGSGTTTINLTESQLFDGMHTEACSTPSPTPSPTPAGDTDEDGWSDGAEGMIGTDPFDGCADNPTDDAWPADINNNGFSDTADIAFVTGYFGDAVPLAPARADIGPDPPNGFVDTADIARMTGVFGKSCLPP